MADPLLEALSRGSFHHNPAAVPLGSVAEGSTADSSGVSVEVDRSMAHLLLAFSVVPDEDTSNAKDEDYSNERQEDEITTGVLPSGIAITKAGDYVVVDNTNKQGKVFTRSGDYMKFAFGVGMFEDPWDVFISETGKIVVSDTTGRLRVFSRKGKFLQESELGCHLMAARGIAYHPTTKDLLIADPVSSCVYIHNPDGIVTAILTTAGEREKDNFKAPNYIHIDIEGNIYVSDSEANKIHTFSPDKEHKFSFGINASELNTNDHQEKEQHLAAPDTDKTNQIKPDESHKLVNPSGICTDKHGNLLIADTGKGRVLAISAVTGQFRGDVLTWEDGIADPVALAIDSNTGNLAVTEASTGLVKVFAYSHLPCCTVEDTKEEH